MDSAMFGFAKSAGRPHVLRRLRARRSTASTARSIAASTSSASRTTACSASTTPPEAVCSSARIRSPSADRAIALSSDRGKTITAVATFGDVEGPGRLRHRRVHRRRRWRRALRGSVAGGVRVRPPSRGGARSRRGRDGQVRCRRRGRRGASPRRLQRAARRADARSSAPRKRPRIAHGSPRGCCPSWCGREPAGAVDRHIPRLVHRNPG